MGGRLLWLWVLGLGVEEFGGLSGLHVWPPSGLERVSGFRSWLWVGDPGTM